MFMYFHVLSHPKSPISHRRGSRLCSAFPVSFLPHRTSRHLQAALGNKTTGAERGKKTARKWGENEARLSKKNITIIKKKYSQGIKKNYCNQKIFELCQCIFPWFSAIFHGFHQFSMVFIHLPWFSWILHGFSSILHAVHRFFYGFHWFFHGVPSVFDSIYKIYVCACVIEWIWHKYNCVYMYKCTNANKYVYMCSYVDM